MHDARVKRAGTSAERVQRQSRGNIRGVYQHVSPAFPYDQLYLQAGSCPFTAEPFDPGLPGLQGLGDKGFPGPPESTEFEIDTELTS